MQSKKQLRQLLLKQRRLIPDEIWQQKSQALCDRLSDWQIFQQAQNILAFTSFRQEPDLSSLWQRFPNKKWGFARCLAQNLILIPAIACDRQGYRLGYGGGYYDRWLPNSIGCKTGVIFNEFYLDKLPHDLWDVPLEAIVTDMIKTYCIMHLNP